MPAFKNTLSAPGAVSSCKIRLAAPKPMPVECPAWAHEA